QRLTEHVSHRQRAGDVGRRDHDDERPARGGARPGRGPRLENAARLPLGVPAGFDACWIVGLLKRLRVPGTHVASAFKRERPRERGRWTWTVRSKSEGT